MKFLFVFWMGLGFFVSSFGSAFAQTAPSGSVGDTKAYFAETDTEILRAYFALKTVAEGRQTMVEHLNGLRPDFEGDVVEPGAEPHKPFYQPSKSEPVRTDATKAFRETLQSIIQSDTEALALVGPPGNAFIGAATSLWNRRDRIQVALVDFGLSEKVLVLEGTLGVNGEATKRTSLVVPVVPTFRAPFPADLAGRLALVSDAVAAYWFFTTGHALFSQRRASR